MEEREAKIIFGLTGVNKKSRNGYRGRTTKITLPVSWIDTMNFTPDDRTAKVTFDGDKIIIEKLKK